MIGLLLLVLEWGAVAVGLAAAAAGLAADPLWLVPAAIALAAALLVRDLAHLRSRRRLLQRWRVGARGRAS